MNIKMRFLACAVAACAAFALQADEEKKTDEGAAGIPESLSVPKQEEKLFHLLPFCRLLEGSAEVMRSGKSAWEPIEEGRFYPLGSIFRTLTADSRLTIQFGRECEAEIKGLGAFGTCSQPLGVKSRTIFLKAGTLDVRLPRNISSNNLFKVTSSGFTAAYMEGESQFVYADSRDGDDISVRCVTGVLAVEGRHFRIPAMKAADTCRIRTSQDFLLTALYGKSGNYIVQLDQGQFVEHNFETGEDKIEERKLDWKLSPQTAVRIHRARPSVGERMSVTIMTFEANGAIKNRCAFAEGRPEVNTGEQGEGARAEQEEKAKKALDAAETTTTEAAAEPKTEEAKSEEKSEESTEE